VDGPVHERGSTGPPNLAQHTHVGSSAHARLRYASAARSSPLSAHIAHLHAHRRHSALKHAAMLAPSPSHAARAPACRAHIRAQPTDGPACMRAQAHTEIGSFLTRGRPQFPPGFLGEPALASPCLPLALRLTCLCRGPACLYQGSGKQQPQAARHHPCPLGVTAVTSCRGEDRPAFTRAGSERPVPAPRGAGLNIEGDRRPSGVRATGLHAWGCGRMGWVLEWDPVMLGPLGGMGSGARHCAPKVCTWAWVR